MPVQRVALTGKAAGATDFSATVVQQETGAVLGTVAYRAGPFIVSGTDITPAVTTLVNTYLASDAVTNVHRPGILSRADEHRGSLRRQRPQMDLRRLVRAVLGPHGAVHRELVAVRLASKCLRDPFELVVGQAEGAV